MPTQSIRARQVSSPAAADCTIHEESAEEAASIDHEGSSEKHVFFKSKSSVRFLVWVVKLFISAAVLVCLVLSKLTVVEMTGILYSQHNITAADQQTQCAQYWMLLLAVLIPNLITWFYTLFAGVLMNSATQPWPSKKSLILVSRKKVRAPAVAQMHVYVLVM